MSLSYGNELVGLLLLLSTAQMLPASSSSNSSSSSHLRGDRGRNPNQNPGTRTTTRIVFLPIVNVDTYTLNIQSGYYGNCRTNPRALNCTESYEEENEEGDTTTTTITTGVDLNRNFPCHLDDGDAYCKTISFDDQHKKACSLFLFEETIHLASRKHRQFVMLSTSTTSHMQWAFTACGI